MATPHSPALRGRFRAAALAVAGTLIIAVGAMAVTPAQGTYYPPVPTGISATATTDNEGLGGAVPDVLVAAGQPLQLTVTLQPYGAAFKDATRLTLTPSLESGASPKGTLTPNTILMPAGVNSARFSVSYSATDRPSFRRNARSILRAP